MVTSERVCEEHNHPFTLTEVERFVHEGPKTEETSGRWKKEIEHKQQKIEDHYWVHDGVYEEMMDTFTTHVGDDLSSTGDSSSAKDSSSED